MFFYLNNKFNFKKIVTGTAFCTLSMPMVATMEAAMSNNPESITVQNVEKEPSEANDVAPSKAKAHATDAMASNNDAKAKANVNDTKDAFDWEPVMNAIIQVESGGNAKAVSGIYSGAMQIAPILVTECNNILKARGSKKRYTLNDRFSIQKSKEMFLIIQSKYNPNNNVERAIRSWSGGIGYKISKTNRYYNKVMAVMNR